jgi:hypothetical protein
VLVLLRWQLGPGRVPGRVLHIAGKAIEWLNPHAEWAL